MRPVRFLLEAHADVNETVDWYNDRSSGLGDDFLSKLDECLQRVENRPLTFPAVFKNIRRGILKRFPYCIFFVIRDNDIVVLAVLHGGRDPQTWQSRRVH